MQGITQMDCRLADWSARTKITGRGLLPCIALATLSSESRPAEIHTESQLHFNQSYYSTCTTTPAILLV